jgi:hypothetical protein
MLVPDVVKHAVENEVGIAGEAGIHKGVDGGRGECEEVVPEPRHPAFPELRVHPAAHDEGHGRSGELLACSPLCVEQDVRGC